MSNQVYRNNDPSKYSPSKLVNVLELRGATQSIAGSYSPNSVCWNFINGQNANPVAGIINYLPYIFPGSEDIIPVYNTAIKPYTFFKIMTSGTYTINVTLVMQGATVTNEMRGIGIAICDKGSLTPQTALRGLTCQWGPSSGVVNPGNWCISAQYSGYFEAGQSFFPAAISSNGINFPTGLTIHGQTSRLEYFKN